MTAPKRICLLPDDGWSWVEGPKPPYEENAIEYVRADLAAAQPAHGVWNKCTFDLSGAGYDCAIKDGDARHGAYGEGQKVFWDGTTVNADGLYILSKLALDKRIAAAQPAQARVKPTDAQINSACLSYRHDFGLMTKRNQDDLRFQANEWLIAWQKETRILPTLEPQPDPRADLAAVQPDPNHRRRRHEAGA